MAEKKTAKAAKPKAKKAKAAATKTPARAVAKKPALKKKPAPRPKKAAPRRPQPKSATINIAELFDHPLVADLLAVGATAALAAIAESRFSRRDDVGKKSSRALKAAAKAAAAAMGRRLSTEVGEIRAED